MTVRVDVSGLHLALEGLTTKIGLATAEGAARGALVYERAIKEQIKGGHPKGTKTGATPGGAPQNITGNLRRSVGVGPVVGNGVRYEVEIGPSAVYGQYLEGGTSRMPAYPFVRPAAHRVELSGEVHATILAAWRRALGV
jgi:HK97 gp10 family phage protein